MYFDSHCSRRSFLRLSLAGAGVAIAVPTIVPSSVFGAGAPSNKIQVGQIGCGRIAHQMDMRGILAHDNLARLVAVCDVDSRRLEIARKHVEEAYAKKKGSDKAVAVKTFGDYRELIAHGGIDAVSISTPDHWHAEPIIVAALTGKDVWVQKPLTMTLEEGRLVSDIVQSKKRAFQIGSQQRSTRQFRLACELVRNGRIGKLHTVKIGLPTDPSGDEEPEIPVPPNLNYDLWLGSTPLVPYTEKRVHSQTSIEDRPGWLRIDSYCLGMITGWGSHHVDIAHWGMDTELTGPIEAVGKAEFPPKGLWNVHGPYYIEMKYANGVTMIIHDKFTNGVRFEGSNGWIFVSRGGAKATASDPASEFGKALDASSPDILNAPLGASEKVRLHKSDDHHLDWLQSIKTRKPAVTTPEIAHRSTSACIIGWISMKLGRKVEWDPQKEVFNDPEANALRARTQRTPYGTRNLKKA